MYPIGVYIARFNCSGFDQVKWCSPSGRCRAPRVYEAANGSADARDGFGEGDGVMISDFVIHA